MARKALAWLQGFESHLGRAYFSIVSALSFRLERSGQGDQGTNKSGGTRKTPF